MKLLCLLGGVVKPGDRWLWKYLPSNNNEPDFLVIAMPERQIGADRQIHHD